MADLEVAKRKVKALRNKYALRDARNAEVEAVLEGNFDDVAPDLFSSEWPRPLVANRISVFTRHAGAALAPLPNLSCTVAKANSDSARRFAETRGKIVDNYFSQSLVQAQMQRRAGQFYTHGLIVTTVEPNFDEGGPQIVVESPANVYPVWDRLGRTSAVAMVFERNFLDLCAEYPEHETALKQKFGARRGGADPSKTVEVVKWVDGERLAMWLERDDTFVFHDVPNPMGKCPAVATPLPGSDGTSGAFDDLIWVQLGLHAMQVYTMQGVAQAVNAPIAVGSDVIDVEIGPGAIIRANEPDKIRRVNLDVPQGAWAAQEYLSREVEFGAIVPEALGGSIDASVVTGKGVQQLMAGYSQQIAMAQESLAAHWKAVAELAFRVDETYFSNTEKQISGVNDSAPYSLTYTPAKDIKGDHSVQVQYGGVAGMDPNRSLVYLLQELGGEIVSKDYVRRHLPSDINATEEESKIVLEQARGSLVQMFSAYVQSLPEMMASGQDPSEIIARAVSVTEGLQKGEPIETLLAEVFPPPPPPEEQQAQDPMAEMLSAEQQAQGSGGGGGLEGLRPGALATRGPGARPDMSMLFAGTNASGQPNLQAGVSRMIPSG